MGAPYFTTDATTRLEVLVVLRRERARQDLSCAAIAARADLNEKTVRRLFRNRQWSWATVEAVARVLRVEIRVNAVVRREEVTTCDE